MIARPPSIKREQISARVNTDQKPPVAMVEVDRINPREHAAWMQKVADRLTEYDPQTITAVAQLLSEHTSNTSNPHQTSAAQIGADPAGTAAAAGAIAADNLTAHTGNNSVHGIGVGSTVVGTATAQVVSNKDIRATYVTSATNLTLSATITKLTSAVIATIPTAVGVVGKEFIIDNAATADCTVTPTGAETIEGEITQPLPPNSTMVVYSDGANWRIK